MDVKTVDNLPKEHDQNWHSRNMNQFDSVSVSPCLLLQTVRDGETVL